jgi:prefoldin subunit 5
LSREKEETELRKVKKEIGSLRRRLAVLEARKTELENALKKPQPKKPKSRS